jgi:hypothetical protein
VLLQIFLFNHNRVSGRMRITQRLSNQGYGGFCKMASITQFSRSRPCFGTLSLSIVALLALSGLLVATAHADQISWTGNSSSTWVDGSNWAGGTAPANSTTTDTVLFNQASYTNQPNYGTTSIEGITLGGPSSDFAGTLTLNGTELIVGSGGITINPGAVNDVTLNGSVRLDGDQTWTKGRISDSCKKSWTTIRFESKEGPCNGRSKFRDMK